MTASPSQPPMTALQLEVLEEFGAVSQTFRCARFEREAEWEADTTERRQERDRDRKARTRAEILADLRRLQEDEEGTSPEFEWRTCPTCGMSFAVLRGACGRPRVHCCALHAGLARWRRWWAAATDRVPTPSNDGT